MPIIGVIETLALEVGPITLGLLAGWLVERLLLRSLAQWTAGRR